MPPRKSYEETEKEIELLKTKLSLDDQKIIKIGLMTEAEILNLPDADLFRLFTFHTIHAIETRLQYADFTEEQKVIYISVARFLIKYI